MTPAQVMDAFAGGDHSAASRALQSVQGQVSYKLRDRTESLAADILQDYLLDVLSNRARTVAWKTLTWAGVRQDFQRFQGRRERSSLSPGLASRPYESTLYRKTLRLLRGSGSFRELPGGKGKLRYFAPIAPSDERRDPFEEVVARLPPVPSVLDDGRSDRHAPVVGGSDLEKQVERIFAIGGGGARPVFEIVEMVFLTLQPMPPRTVAAIEFDAESWTGLPALEPWAISEDQKAAARRFVAGLTPTTREVVRLRFWSGTQRQEKPPTLAEIGDELAMTTQAVGYHLSDKGPLIGGVRRFCAERDLTLDEGRDFLQLVLDFIGAGNFGVSE